VAQDVVFDIQETAKPIVAKEKVSSVAEQDVPLVKQVAPEPGKLIEAPIVAEEISSRVVSEEPKPESITETLPESIPALDNVDAVQKPDRQKSKSSNLYCQGFCQQEKIPKKF